MKRSKSAQRPRRSPGRSPKAGPSHRHPAPGHGQRASPKANQAPGRRPLAKPREGIAGLQGRWVIGLRACEEAAKVRRSAIAGALIRADWERASQLRELKASLDRAGVPSETRSQEQLDAIGSGHQGIALCVQESPKVDWAQLESAASAIVLILDGLEDPQNLGSILRTAWLTGVDAVLAPADRAVGLTPTACKVASGGAEHVPFETHASFGPAMQRLKDAGFWLYGLGEGGRAKPWDLQLAKKTVWVVGSEASGMRVATERACDELVRIPQVATGSSYNAAVAVAMALGETCRQMGRLE